MLVVLTVISLVASTVAVWGRATVLDTDRFVEVVGPALTDPAFPAAVAAVVADDVLVALDLEARVAASLEAFDTFIADAVLEAAGSRREDRDRPSLADRPTLGDRPTLAALAPGIASALEARVVEIVDELVASEAVVARLPSLVREVHEGAVALVRGDLAQLPNVEVRDGEVQLDLSPVIARALREVLVELRAVAPDVAVPEVTEGRADVGRQQLAEALQTRLPADFGQLTLVSRGDLAELQSAVRSVDRFVGALVGLTVVLGVTTIATSRRRRRTVAQLAAGLTFGMGIAVLLVGRIEGIVLGAITDPEADRAARALLGELAQSLRSVAALVAVTALTIAVSAYVVGQPSWLTRRRGRRGWATEQGPATGRGRSRPPAAGGAPIERSG